MCDEYAFANCLGVHTYGTVYVPIARYCEPEARLKHGAALHSACGTHPRLSDRFIAVSISPRMGYFK